MLKKALQLYTVRDVAEKDLLSTLEKVAAQGYEGVEFAGFFNVSAEKLKSTLDRLGLTVVGSHTSLDLLVNHLDDIIRYNQIIGNSYIVCPWAKMENKEDVELVISQLKAAMPKIKAAGMTLAYHNHAHELEKIENKYILDTLVEALDGDLVLEVDTFWVHHAGVEVVDYLHTHQKDIALVHVKDGKDGTPMALGEGTAPVKAVVKAAEEIGLEWLIVENDNPTPNGLADSERSFAYLKTNC